MTSQKIRIAFIGLGDIAQKAYLPIVTNHAKVQPILCTRNTKTLNRLAIKYRIDETYSDVDELIRNKVDAAMIHSSTVSHFILVSKFLNAGIPIFLDKPLCYNLSESEELLNLAAQKQVLLYLGFNRRFAPLIQTLTHHPNPIQINWQKNRVGLPDAPRVFVLDDFIHVLDTLRFLGTSIAENIQVFSKLQNNKLESLQVQWQQNGALFNGSMNRISGITEERVEYYTADNKWQIEELVSGFHYKNEIIKPLGFNNWENTLYKRGFLNLFEDWLSALQATNFDTNRNQDIWETHHLCEMVVQKVLKKNH